MNSKASSDSAGARVRISVALKLTILVAATIVVLEGVLLAGGYRFWRSTLREHIDDRLRAVAVSRRDMVLGFVAQLRQRAEVNSDRGEFLGFLYEHTGQPDTPNRHWSQTAMARIADGKSILSARMADAGGAVLLATDPSEIGMNLAADAGFAIGLEDSHLGMPRPAGARFVADLVAPIRSRTQPIKTMGVLILTVDMTPLADALRDRTGLGQTGEVLLGVREGGPIRFLFPPRYWKGVLPAIGSPSLRAMGDAIAGHSAVVAAPDYRGVRSLAAPQPVGYGGWGIVAKMDEAEAFAPITDAAHDALLLGGGVGVAGLVAAVLLARGFTRPIRRLVAAAARVSEADDTTTVPVTRSDELGILARSFNDMTAAIRARRAERDAKEAALRESEERLKAIGDRLPNGAIYQYGIRPDGSDFFTHLSAGVERATGHTNAELMARPAAAFDNVVPEDREAMVRATTHSAETLSAFDHEYRRRAADGSIRWCQSRSMPRRLGDGNILWDGVEFDVTDRKRTEAERQSALEQATVLLSEVHHRVKNNMQVISSLLRLQSASLRDPVQRAVFEDCRERIVAMALIHERLYASGKFAVIEFSGYLTEMVRMIISSSVTSGANVRLDFQLEPVEVGVDVAVPLSLIASELVLNAVKHAFGGGRGGVLTVRLRAGEPMHELIIQDDGPGFPSSPASDGGGIGLSLFEGLTRQIRGERKLDTGTNGVTALIRWPAQRP